MKQYVHMPHNAIFPGELRLLIEVALKYKNEKGWIEKRDLKKMFLFELLVQKKFEKYHKKVFQDFKNGNVYEGQESFLKLINNPTEGVIDECFKLKKTEKKRFKELWNEYYRDYEELVSWLGILPAYHKGLNKLDAPKYIFVSTFAEKVLSDKNFFLWIFINLKYKNSTKNWQNLKQYNNNIKPIWEILALAKKRGYKVTKDELSFVATYIANENTFANHQFDKKRTKEFGRVRTFLNKWLEYFGLIDSININKGIYVFNKEKVDEILENSPSHTVFIDQKIGDSELTPQVIYKIFNLKMLYWEQKKKQHLYFDAKNELEKLLNITIEKYIEINPYSDSYYPNILSHEFKNSYKKDGKVPEVKHHKITNIINNLEKQEFIDISKSSNGAMFEEKVYNVVAKLFKNTNWEGTSSTGQRISDIWALINIDNQKVATVIETKSGKSPLDDRKETDNLFNTIKKIYSSKLNENNSFDIDYVWYWYVTNSIPNENAHGGNREGSFKKSFEEKLSSISREVLLKTGKPVFVMAISPEDLLIYLQYIFEKTKIHPIEEVFSMLVNEIGYKMTIFKLATWSIFKREAIVGYIK